MKSSEFKSIWSRLKPFVTDEFRFRGSEFFLLPVDHSFRAVLFERSDNPRHFYLQLAIVPLYIPREQITLCIGWRLGGGCKKWDADDPNLIEDILPFIEREALPFLRHAATPFGVAECAISLNLPGDLNVVEAIGYSLARAGRYAEAVPYLDRFIAMVGDWREWQRIRLDRARKLKAMILEDPNSAEIQFRDWESFSAKNLNLESLRAPQ